MARKAWIIGSNGPEDKPDLRFALSDAARVGAALTSPICDFKVNLCSARERLQDVRQQVEEFILNSAPEDEILVYFVGHAVVVAGSLHFVLSTTDTETIQTSALDLGNVVSALAKCKARQRALILDCCHAATVWGHSGTGTNAAVRAYRPLLEQTLNFVILMAGGHADKAMEHDSWGGGFLSAAISKALAPDGLYSIADKAGRVTEFELYGYLVAEAAKWNSGNPERRVPRPEISLGKKGGGFVFGGSVVGPELAIHPSSEPFAAFGTVYSEKLVGLIGVGAVTSGDYSSYLSSSGGTEPIGNGPDGLPGFRALAGPRGSSKPITCLSLEDAIRYSDWWSRTHATDSIEGYLPSDEVRMLARERLAEPAGSILEWSFRSADMKVELCGSSGSTHPESELMHYKFTRRFDIGMRLVCFAPFDWVVQATQCDSSILSSLRPIEPGILAALRCSRTELLFGMPEQRHSINVVVARVGEHWMYYCLELGLIGKVKGDVRDVASAKAEVTRRLRGRATDLLSAARVLQLDNARAHEAIGLAYSGKHELVSRLPLEVLTVPIGTANAIFTVYFYHDKREASRSVRELVRDTTERVRDRISHLWNR